MLTPEKLIELRKELKNSGLLETKNIEDYFLITKHISSYLSFLAFMKKYGIQRSSFVLNRLYRADIVIRQEFQKVLNPIEFSITSKLLYLIEEYGYSYNTFVNTNNELEEIIENSSLVGYNKKIRYTTLEFVREFINNVGGSHTRDMTKVIWELSFGQIAALISILPDEFSRRISGLEKEEFITALNYVVAIRNHIAHQGLILINRNISNKKVNIPIEEIINNIDMIAHGDFKREFGKTIIGYQQRVIKKIGREEKSEKNVDNIKKMFEGINSKLGIENNKEQTFNIDALIKNL